MQKFICILKFPPTRFVCCLFVCFYSVLAQARCEPLIRPSVKNPRLVSRRRPLSAAGGRRRFPPLAHMPWQLRGLGQMEFPAWLRGRRVIRPRSLLPEVRAPGSAPWVGASGGQFRGVSTLSLPAAPAVPSQAPVAGLRAAAPRLGPPLAVISAPKVEMRKFPAATDR